MWTVFGVFVKGVLFIPLVVVHLVISFLAAGSGDANWGLGQSIRATMRGLFGED